MSKYCLFLIVIYYLTGGNNSMSRFCKFGKLHVTKGNVDKLLALNEGLSSFLALMVQIVVLFLSAYFIITGRITIGTLLGMVQVSSNLANPLIMIFTNVPKIKSIQPIMDNFISNFRLSA